MSEIKWQTKPLARCQWCGNVHTHLVTNFGEKSWPFVIIIAIQIVLEKYLIVAISYGARQTAVHTYFRARWCSLSCDSWHSSPPPETTVDWLVSYPDSPWMRWVPCTSLSARCRRAPRSCTAETQRQTFYNTATGCACVRVFCMVCVWLYECMVCVRVCMFICVCACLFACACVRACVCACVRVCVNYGLQWSSSTAAYLVVPINLSTRKCHRVCHYYTKPKQMFPQYIDAGVQICLKGLGMIHSKHKRT